MKKDLDAVYYFLKSFIQLIIIILDESMEFIQSSKKMKIFTDWLVTVRKFISQLKKAL
jgi:hypothetical protein